MNDMQVNRFTDAILASLDKPNTNTAWLRQNSANIRRAYDDMIRESADLSKECE